MQPSDDRRKAWLVGDEMDLQVLVRLLVDDGVRVLHDPDEGAYYLTAPEIDDPPVGTPFYDVATNLIVRLNGLGRLADPGFRPVTLSGKYTDGESQHQIIAAVSLECRVHLAATATVIGPDGAVVPDPPSPWPGRLATIRQHPDADEVLEMLGQPELLGWGELFKIHEKIQDSISGSIVKVGWASNGEDAAFTASANRYDISGRDARHARREKRPPPKQTMTIQQGREYIGRIVVEWLEWLRNHS